MRFGNNNASMFSGFETRVIESKLTSGWDYLIAAFSASIATSSLLLNGLLLGVKYMRRKKLRTIDFLIINLAIVDIGMAITVFPLFIYSSATHEWRFGDIGCNYFAFMSFALGVCSMITLTEIAIVRYQMVCGASSLCVRCKPSSRPGMGTSAMMGFPYFYGMLWGIGPFFGLGQYGYLPYGLSCSLTWDKRQLYFLVASCVFCLVIPVVVMVYCYASIVLKKKRSSRSIVRLSVGPHRSSKHSNLTLKTLTMCLTFVSAWTPYAIMGLIMMFSPVKQFPMALSVIPSLCAKTSITTNPIVHATISSSFRADVKLFFRHIKSSACLKSHKTNCMASCHPDIPKGGHNLSITPLCFTETRVISSGKSVTESSASL